MPRTTPFAVRIFYEFKRNKAKILAYFSIFFSVSQIRKTLVRIFYNLNIQKPGKTSINSPSKAKIYHILPFIKKTQENSFFAKILRQKPITRTQKTKQHF